MALGRLKNWVAEVLTYSDLNSEFNNILNGANSLISPFTADVAAGGFKITGLGAGTARTDAASLATIQDGTGIYVATVGGTADAITLTPSPAITAYAAGQAFYWIASGANTTAVTLAVSGLASPKAVTKNGSTALVAGDIASGALVGARYDGTQFQLIGNVGLRLAGGTMTGDITMSGASIFDANASIAAHATTMDPWSLGNYVTLTGAAVTFTALTAAPQAGAEVELYMNAAHVFTDGAVFEVDGNANYTATAGDRVVMRAKSTTVFTVHPRKADGTAVVVVAAAAIATQAQMEAATDNTVMVTPLAANWHPGVCKVWCKANAAGATSATWNMTSVTDVGTGQITFNVATDFSSANWAGLVSAGHTTNTLRYTEVISQAAGTLGARFNDAATDPTFWFFAGFGDQ